MTEQALWITILASIAAILFVTAKIRQLVKVRKWRKQLARRDYVKFFHGSAWHVGQIRQFKNNGSTLIVREITNDYSRAPFQFSIPLKIAIPVHKI